MTADYVTKQQFEFRDRRDIALVVRLVPQDR